MQMHYTNNKSYISNLAMFYYYISSGIVGEIIKMRNSFWFPFRFWVAFTDVVGVEATPGDMRGGGRGAIATSWETSRG
jgi:hypothetical protein